MRWALVILIGLASAFGLGTAQAGVIDPEVAAFVANVKIILPKDGWKVSVASAEAGREQVVVEREAMVGFAPMGLVNAGSDGSERANSIARQDLHDGKYHFTFMFGPVVSLAAYEKRVEQNAMFDAEKEKLAKELKVLEYVRPGIHPTAPATLQPQMDAYQKFADALKYNELPDFFLPTRSVVVTNDWWGGDFVYDDKVRTECEGLRVQIQSLMGAYDALLVIGQKVNGVYVTR